VLQALFEKDLSVMTTIFLPEKTVRTTRIFASATVAESAAKPHSNALHSLFETYRGWVLHNAERRFGQGLPVENAGDDGVSYAEMRGM
jgi:hypothetical protein